MLVFEYANFVRTKRKTLCLATANYPTRFRENPVQTLYYGLDPRLFDLLLRGCPHQISKNDRIQVSLVNMIRNA